MDRIMEMPSDKRLDLGHPSFILCLLLRVLETPSGSISCG